MPEMKKSPGKSGENFFQKHRVILLVILIIALGMAYRTWAALQWPANFDGDESVMGLMARHIAQGQGQIPLYVYGQRYIGSLEAIVAAGFLKLFGEGVFQLRLVTLIWSALFLVVHFIFSKRLWGPKVALISLLMLALASRWILNYTYRPQNNYASLLILGAAVFLLLDILSSKKAVSFPLLVVLGILIGLGFWSTPQFLYYPFTLGVIYLLQSQEWQTGYHRLENVINTRFKGALKAAGLGLSLSLFCLFFLLMFTKGWQPESLFKTLRPIAGIAILLIGIGLAVFHFAVSRRRKTLFWGAICLGLGLAIGNLPQWGGWLFGGIRPQLFSLPSTPAGIIVRGKMLIEWLLPSMWGLAPLTTIPDFHPPAISLWAYHPWQMRLWFLAGLLILSSVLYFLGKERKTIYTLFTLSPLPDSNRNALLIGLLFFVPMISCLGSGTLFDIYGVRYLITSWHAGSIILALFLVRLMNWSRPMGWYALIIAVIFVGLFNFLEMHRRCRLYHPYDPKFTAGLAEVLERNQVQGAYACHWIAYPLDYLTQERFSIAPYDGVDRWQPFRDKALSAPVQTYILCTPNTNSILQLRETRLDLFCQEVQKLPHFEMPLLKKLQGRCVLNREQTGIWDVWMIGDSLPTDSASRASTDLSRGKTPKLPYR
jgi:hypothetical protein